jgi:hypothetical protein
MTGTVHVDLAELQATCAAVRTDVEQGLRPGISDTDRKVQTGVRFGLQSPSGEADAARRALLATMKRHRENGQRHLSTADHLVAALDQILANYARADAGAALDVNAIEAVLDATIPEPKIPHEVIM